MTRQFLPTAPVGVFDSGIGGLSVLRALCAELPQEDFVYLDDSGFAPYGERGDAYVIERSRAVTQHLRRHHGIKALVIACNTATVAAVAHLRAEHPDLPIIGVEPGLKPAVAISKTRRIAVIGTRGTVSSERFAALRHSLQDQVEFSVRACDGLADAIQRSVVSGDDSQARELCAAHLGALGRFGTAPGEMDTLVLGCTHYVFVQDHLADLVGPGVQILSTGAPVARRTRRVLEASSALATHGQGQLTLTTTGDPAVLQAAARRWLHTAAEPVVSAPSITAARCARWPAAAAGGCCARG